MFFSDASADSVHSEEKRVKFNFEDSGESVTYAQQLNAAHDDVIPDPHDNINAGIYVKLIQTKMAIFIICIQYNGLDNELWSK